MLTVFVNFPLAAQLFEVAPMLELQESSGAKRGAKHSQQTSSLSLMSILRSIFSKMCSGTISDTVADEFTPHSYSPFVGFHASWVPMVAQPIH